MQDKLTAEYFQGIEGETVMVTVEDAQVSATVNECKKCRDARPGEQRDPFSVSFLLPGEQVHPQGTYAFELPELGEVMLFVVPLGQDESGVTYEAVFT